MLERARNLGCGLSFAPLGLCLSATFSHGLRRGLHSYAAPRLNGCGFVRPRCRNSGAGLVNVSRVKVKVPQGLKPAFLLILSDTAGSRALPTTIYETCPTAYAVGCILTPLCGLFFGGS